MGGAHEQEHLAGERPLFLFKAPKYLTSLTKRCLLARGPGAAAGVRVRLPRPPLREAVRGHEPCPRRAAGHGTAARADRGLPPKTDQRHHGQPRWIKKKRRGIE